MRWSLAQTQAWKLTLLLLQREILVKNKQHDAKRGDETTNNIRKKKANTMNERLGRLALRSSPQRKLSYLHSIAMNLYIFDFFLI